MRYLSHVLCLSISIGAACTTEVSQEERLETTVASAVNAQLEFYTVPQAIDAGWYHTCGLTKAGRAECWGRDNHGQVSNTSNNYFSDIGVGGYHSCGLTASGSVECWGRNNYDQLNAPQVAFKQIAIGGYHNCGITQDGSAECWGWNRHQQSTAPARNDLVSVSTSLYNSCAIKETGKIVCWGSNRHGISTPPQTLFSQISMGAFHGCGVTQTGSIECWGYSGFGLSQVPLGNDFVEIQSGNYHACARSKDNKVSCWGANWFGQTTSPEDKEFAQIASGYAVSCGVDHHGVIECWGSNAQGQAVPPAGVEFSVPVRGNVCEDAIAIDVINGRQIITGDTSNATNDYYPGCAYSFAPDQVYSFTLEQETEVEALVSGYDTVMFIRSTCESSRTRIACNDQSNPPGRNGSRVQTLLQPGTYYLFVDGYRSYRGTYSLDITFTPSDVDECQLNLDNCNADATCVNNIGGFTCECNDGFEGNGVECADIDECVIEADNCSENASCTNTLGSFTCECNDGYEGDGVACSDIDECAQGIDSCGANEVCTNRDPFVIAPAISSGGGRACLLQGNGGVLCWGQLPYLWPSNTPYSRSKGVFTQISVGANFSCGVKENAAVQCWGNLTNYDTAEDIQVPYTAFKQVSVGDFHACGITLSGDVSCWGADSSGETRAPAGVTYTEVHAGRRVSCGIREDRTVDCWGDMYQAHQFLDMGFGVDPQTFSQISLGEFGRCGITTNNELQCDGAWSWPEDQPYIQVSVGRQHACALNEAGNATCWGAIASTPQTAFTSISSGGDHSCGVTSAGDVECWSANGARNLVVREREAFGIGTDIVLETQTQGYMCHCSDGFLTESWVESTGELVRRCLDLSNYPPGSGASQQNPWIGEHQRMTHECEISCDQNASCSTEQFSPVCLCDEGFVGDGLTCIRE